jgi:N-acetylglutamate synthase-like GNAT family acetyltransferase
MHGYLERAGFTSIHIELIPNSMKSLYFISATKAPIRAKVDIVG